MIKNRLIWNIALFLIAIISLPLAYAQTSLGGSLYFVIVNAAIIGIILFALQAYLIPRKPEKERTVVWAVILVASLLIAWLVGREGYIWQGSLRGFFSIYVLVNAILIGAFLYFLLGFLKIGQFASKEGNAGYGILLFLVAIVFAVKLGNQWLWDQGTIRLFGSYLFGSEGILNPSGPEYRLWTFIGSAVLLTFFFQNYLVTGGEKKVNYALALVIAANLASGGIRISSVVIMAEIVFLITMANTLGGTTTKTWGANWFIAAFLIGWGSAAATYGTEYQGVLASIVGWFLSWFGLVGAGEFARPTTGAGWFGWIGKAGIAALIPIVILALIFYGIGRGERLWKFKELKDRYYGVLFFNAIWMRWNSLLNRTLFPKLWIKRRLEPNRLPQVLRENIVILFSLSNYLKRLYILYSKMGQATKAAEVSNLMWEVVGDYHDIKELEEYIYKCRNRGMIRVKVGGVLSEVEVGWFNGIKESCKTIDEATDFLKGYLTHVITKEKSDKVAGKYKYEQEDLNTAGLLADKLSSGLGKYIEPSIDYLEKMSKAYGAHQPIKAWKYLVLDQCNPYGQYEHNYKFVKKGTKLSEGEAEEELEVNQYAEVLKDKYKNNGEWFEPWKEFKKQIPRRVKNTDEIYDFEVKPENSPAAVMNYIATDWKGFIDTLRHGQYHYYSKSVMDYVRALSTKKGDPNALGRDPFFEEKNIKTSLGPKDKDNPAFDRRLLVDTGFNTLNYIGRKRFYDKQTDIELYTEKNPYPALSSIGMGLYMIQLAKRDVDDEAGILAYLRKFLRDTGKHIEEPTEAYKAFGSLGDELATKKGEE